ncbi:MAG: oligosaccharide flippase family protein [Actinomycetota bacterium]
MFRIILTIGAIQILAIAINFVRTKLVAVLVGPEGVGIISTIDQVVQTASYFSALSLPFVSVKYLSKAHSEGSESFKKTYANFLKVLLILSSVGAIIASGVVIFRPQLFGQEVMKYRMLLGLALLGVPTMVLGGFFMQTLAAAQKPKHSSILTVLGGATLTIATVVGVIVGGVFGFYIATVIVGFLITAATLIYLRKVFDLPFYDRAASFLGELKTNPDIIPFALMLYFATLTYSLSFLVVRYTVLKNYGEASAGFLHAAIALSLAIGMALNPANGLYLTPIMNRKIEKKEKIKAAFEFEKKFAIILSLVSMPVVLFPNLMLAVLFSTEFMVVSQFVFLFVAAQVISQLAGIHQALLIGFDDLKAYSLMTCIGHISLGLLSWFLIPYFGIYGAAIGFITAYSIIFISTLLRLRIKHGFVMPGQLKILLLYILTVILLAGAVSTQYEAWSVIIIAAKIGVCLLFMLSLLFYLSKEERGFLYSYLDKIRFKKTLNA